MDNNQTQDAQSVTQADRDAAASFYQGHLARPGEVPVAAAMRMGHIDESPLIQAFARHRLASQPTSAEDAVADMDYPAGAIENGREFLRRLADDYRYDCEAGPLAMCYDYLEAVRCFEWLAMSCERLASRPAPDTQTAAIRAEAMREALEKAAVRFEHCAEMIGGSFNIPGTLRAERTIKAKHYALEARAALSQSVAAPQAESDYCDKCDDSGYAVENGKQVFCDCICGHDAMDQAEGKGFHARSTPPQPEGGAGANAAEAVRQSLDNAIAQVAADAIRASFFTSVSGGDRYYLSLAYPTMDAMHKAEDEIKAFIRWSRFLPLEQRLALQPEKTNG